MAKHKQSENVSAETAKPAKVCPISRADFVSKAKPIAVSIAGQPMAAMVKEFSTGSFGWFVNGKLFVDVEGTMCEVQLGLNLTVVKSKEAK